MCYVSPKANAAPPYRTQPGKRTAVISNEQEGSRSAGGRERTSRWPSWQHYPKDRGSTKAAGLAIHLLSLPMIMGQPAYAVGSRGLGRISFHVGT